MPFSWAGAGAGAQAALQQQLVNQLAQEKQQADLENQLAEREYRRQTIAFQQAQNERLANEFAAGQSDKAARRQALDAAGADIEADPSKPRWLGKLVRAGEVSPGLLMPTTHE